MALPLPSPVRLLLGAHLADGALVDVRLEGPVVAEIVPAGTLRAGRDEPALDLDGFLLLPAAAEPHAHLDKSLTFDEIRPPLGDLGRAIASFQEFAATADEDLSLMRKLAEYPRLVESAALSLEPHAATDRLRTTSGTTIPRYHVPFFILSSSN